MQSDNVKIQKEKFLENEIATLSILGGFGRANIYEKNIGEKDRNEFRKFIRKSLKRYGEKYRNEKISENQHFLNIEKLAKEITTSHGWLLSGGELRIGIAQKLLNLYLKYLWLLYGTKIFHCPFDSRVIKKLRDVKNACRTWTRCNHIKCYREWVAAAKCESDGKSIAEWELRIWNEANDTGDFDF